MIGYEIWSVSKSQIIEFFTQESNLFLLLLKTTYFLKIEVIYEQTTDYRFSPFRFSLSSIYM